MAPNPAQTTEILLAPGDILYREGDSNECAYIISAGELILYCTIDGQRVDIERRGAGSIMGELSILTGRPRAVTVEALTPCRAFKLSGSQVTKRLDALDPVLRACIDTSISFAATLNEQATQTPSAQSPVPFAPAPLTDAPALIEQFQFENDLVRGLEAEEFKMLYQPIVALDDGSITGFEALMRWNHPTRGAVPPDRFIQSAEHIGFIHQLTDFALMQACAARKRLRAIPNAPQDLFVSVNISGCDISRADFVDFLAHVVDLNALSPHHIKLELTETALILDTDAADKNLTRLRDLGFGISVDDFGTGYSNLGYLQSLPLTALKIDRAFAGDAHENAVSRGIVRLLVALGKELGVDIIAEGLETRKDVDTLCELGCQFAQGYYFYKPMDEAQITAELQVQLAQTGPAQRSVA